MKMVMSTQVTWPIHSLEFVRSAERCEDVKLNNIFVNYANPGENGIRFSEVRLGEFGGTYPQDSEWAKSGTLIGGPLWNSPEVLLETPWNTATDILSFGTVVSPIE